MDIFEITEIQSKLVEAFPNFFKIDNEGVTTGVFKAKRGEWVILQALSGNPRSTLFDALLGACLDAADSRGWQMHLIKKPNDDSCASVESLHEGEFYTPTGAQKIVYPKTIAFETDQNIAFAAAKALLKAHQKQ